MVNGDIFFWLKKSVYEIIFDFIRFRFFLNLVLVRKLKLILLWLWSFYERILEEIKVERKLWFVLLEEIRCSRLDVIIFEFIKNFMELFMVNGGLIL